MTNALLPGTRRRRSIAGVVLAGLSISLAVPVAVAGSLAVSGASASASTATGAYNYGEALQKAIYFYDEQRVGKLPADNRVNWRGDALLNDGKDVGLDLTGGFMDAGDEVKFGFPAAYAMTMLAWGVDDDRSAYTDSGQLPYLLSNLKWGTDFIIKQHVAPHTLYGQEGNGGIDHAWWGSVEVNPTARPSYKIDEKCPGSDLAGESAAALASASIAFKPTDSAYAATLITHAKQLYEFADEFRGKYSDCITDANSYYKSSGYMDELVWGAIWLYRATGDATYLTKAESYYPSLNTEPQSTVHSYKWTLAWDDKSYGDYVLLAELTGKQQYVDDADRWLDYFTTGVNGSRIAYSPGGEAYVDTWGSLRYAANTAFCALIYGDWLKSSGRDTTRAATYHDFAVKQINYALGSNPYHRSYLIGFGANSPKNPHHRTAHGTWTNNLAGAPVTSSHLLIGALVGGPSATDDGATYVDSRNNYQQNEPALDYNAAFTGALARLYGEYGGTPLASFPPKETPDRPEMFVQAAVNSSGANYTEVKAWIVNQSAWPARSLDNASFRYYFTLDAPTKISDITVQANYNQCRPPTGPTQFSGNVYYVTVSCAGTHIAPIGDPQYRAEVQLRITAGTGGVGTWNPANDWSYAGLPTGSGAALATVTNLPLSDGNTLIWGSPPSGTPVTPTPTPTPTSTPTSTPSATPTPSTSPTPSLTPTSPVTPSSTPTVTSTVVPTRSCQVTYSPNAWSTGFTANVTIKNLGPSPVNGWTLSWTFPGNQTVTSAWNATVRQTGKTVTATDAGWNGSIAVGASSSFGFQASYSGTNAAPASFTLNGGFCSVA